MNWHACNKGWSRFLRRGNEGQTMCWGKALTREGMRIRCMYALSTLHYLWMGAISTSPWSVTFLMCSIIMHLQQLLVTHFRRSRFTDKDHVVRYSEGEHHYYGEENLLQECDTYAEKCVDWDSSVGHIFVNEYDVEPWEEHSNSSCLPLPNGGTPTLIVKTENEDESQSVQEYLEAIVPILPALIQNLH